MTKPYSELRAEARAALSGKWMMAALVTLIYLVPFAEDCPTFPMWAFSWCFFFRYACGIRIYGVVP